MGIHSETELNRKFIEFAKLLNIYLNHFPKHEKYALTNQIRSTAYEVYDLISEGQKRLFCFKGPFWWPPKFFNSLMNLIVVQRKKVAPRRQCLLAPLVDKFFPNGRENSFFVRPVVIMYPRPNDTTGNAGVAGPFGNRFGFSVNGNAEIGLGIIRLLRCCGPSAIIREITKAVVFSVNRMMLCWPRPHVLVKCKERILPFVTDGNSRSSVSGITDGVGIATSLLHRVPNIVLWSFPKTMPLSFLFSHNESSPFRLAYYKHYHKVCQQIHLTQEESYA